MDAIERIKNIRFELWIDDNGTIQRNACAFHVDFIQEPKNDDGDKYYQPSPGLNHVWFVLEERDLNRLCRSPKIVDRFSSFTLEDGYHRLHASSSGECTFYDFEFPRESYGRMSVPFARLDLPKAFWRYLGRIARFTWNQKREAWETVKNERYSSRGERTELEIPLSTLARFTSRYGHGKGHVEQMFSERLVNDMGKRPQLKEKVEQVVNIARNYTRNKYHTVSACISNDGEGGYYFSTFDQYGKRGMNGAIVNHSKDLSGNDWSIHT